MEKLPTNFLDRVKVYDNRLKNHTGQCVLYVMGRDQRVQDNFSLVAAQQYAKTKNLPLAVIFVLQKVSQHRAREHYEFMIQGLFGVEKSLKDLQIPFIVLTGNKTACLKAAFYHFNPDAVFFDFSPFLAHKKLINNLASNWQIREVDNHNIVPVWLASDKQEYGARTLRPKIHASFGKFLQEPLQPVEQKKVWPDKTYMTLQEIDQLFLTTLDSIPRNKILHTYSSGEIAARQALDEFLRDRFKGYAENRNNPSIDGLSNLSPYLHFGQISALRVLLDAQYMVRVDQNLQKDYDALLEEMVVRKELSDNYCYYNVNHLSLAGAPTWAQATLAKHQTDRRDFLYTRKQFEDAKTHDEAWNAAQRQLRKQGKIHGYMRMYWAKKVLEWSASPQEAFDTLVYLNDFYSLDGGDPNGYVGILWSIAGLHDRPWGERAVYGTVRSMVYSGLKRKFDIQAYINYN